VDGCNSLNIKHVALASRASSCVTFPKATASPWTQRSPRRPRTGWRILAVD